eukprot:gb/GECG01010986.1/.p1 GENE.gb/GECG01010986.1/~~gb/GECG01010986.1/.p1  ORF type:complete len:141 (+),score=7.30 gb/GECG01010986.1/:1-423(+)
MYVYVQREPGESDQFCYSYPVKAPYARYRSNETLRHFNDVFFSGERWKFLRRFGDIHPSGSLSDKDPLLPFLEKLAEYHSQHDIWYNPAYLHKHYDKGLRTGCNLHQKQFPGEKRTVKTKAIQAKETDPMTLSAKFWRLC